jgi:hypothetical protein
MTHSIKPRIMYIENKGGGFVEMYGQTLPDAAGGDLTGAGRIGRVTFNRTGKTILYGGKRFHPMQGFKSNYVCEETGELFWISGPKKRGGDALYATNIPTEIDEDAREEYWTEIRKQPERLRESTTL